MQVGEAVAKYLAGLPPNEREKYSPQLTYFARWFGWERSIDSLTPPEVEEYVQRSAEEPEILRLFLNYAKKEGFIKLNLASHIRVKKLPVKTTTPPTPSITLTPEGYRQLKEELKELTEERVRLVEEVSRAREDKDFRENAPLQIARERLAWVDSRTAYIEKILKGAETLASPELPVIGPGSKVILKESSGKLVSYQLVDPREADLSRGKLSAASPMGKVLIGKRVGEQVEVKAPAGTFCYQIMEVK